MNHEFRTLEDLISFFEESGEYVERTVVDGRTVVECFHSEGSITHIDDHFLLAIRDFPECANVDSIWIPDSQVTDQSISTVDYFSRLEYLAALSDKPERLM